MRCYGNWLTYISTDLVVIQLLILNVFGPLKFHQYKKICHWK